MINNINISAEHYKKLLSFAIRDNFHLVKLILNFIDYILNYYPYEDFTSRSIHKLNIVKNQSFRIIFQEEDKIFSICFPFEIKKEVNNYTIFDRNLGEISNQELSLLNQIFNNDKICNISDALESYGNLEFLYNEDDYPNMLWTLNEVWELVIKLITYEYGYVRFDHDPTNAKGKIHPLFHLDMSYCNHATYKFGLNKNLSLDQFTDIFNPETDQLFINL
jgi:hypothetical protein